MGIAIGIGISMVAILVYSLITQTDAMVPIRKLQTIDMTQPSKVHEPIEVYENCNSMIRGDIHPDPFIVTFCPDSPFKFKLPPALYGQNTTAVKTNLYQFTETEFEIALFDSVGEKRYKTSLYELSQ